MRRFVGLVPVTKDYSPDPVVLLLAAVADIVDKNPSLTQFTKMGYKNPEWKGEYHCKFPNFVICAGCRVVCGQPSLGNTRRAP
jgi:hypothetical protein